MRVLIVSQYFWPENFRINDLVEELLSRGHEVAVLTGVPNYPSGVVFPEFVVDPGKFRKLGAALIERVPMMARGQGGLRLVLNYASFALSASIFGVWRLRRSKFDVIFVYEPSPITVGIPAILLRRLKRVPLVFWVLDLWPETLKAVGVVKSKPILGVVGFLVSFIYSRCDLILAQSESFVSQIRGYCSKKARIEYFPSWSDAEFDDDSVSAALEIPAVEGQFSVMFAGNIGEAQDFPAIIDAAELARNSQIRWLIVGDGRMASWARAEVVRRNLENKVIFLGQHALERMPSFFKHADALLVSLREDPIFSMTIPGKLQAYLAAGLPILGMLNGEGARIIDNSRVGFAVPAGQGVMLAEAAIRLATMSEMDRSDMGKRGVAYYRNNFDRNRLVSSLVNWFEELVGSNKSHMSNGSTR